jgi:hypothetical protein
MIDPHQAARMAAIGLRQRFGIGIEVLRRRGAPRMVGAAQRAQHVVGGDEQTIDHRSVWRCKAAQDSATAGSYFHEMRCRDIGLFRGAHRPVSASLCADNIKASFNPPILCNGEGLWCNTSNFR